MSSTLTILFFYILASILGALLSWLITGGNKKKISLLQENAQKERSAMNELLTEFNLLKSDAKSQLRLKDQELAKLKKSKAFPDIIANAQEKEITHWKTKAKELENRINQSSNKDNGSSSPKADLLNKQLKQKLELTEKELKAKELVITKMSTSKKKTDSTPNIEKGLSKKKIDKLNKELKAYKKKLKAKPKKEAKTIEIKETLDLKKIGKLLKQGKLTKTSKKVLKNKKKKSKSKKANSKEIPTPSFSEGKSILDIIPELKSNS